MACLNVELPVVILNIACGSNQSYTDPVTGLTWVPDTPYITTGNVHTNLGAPASPPNASGMSTLRYFDDQRTKNCYSLPVNMSSEPSYFYMIRASFFYGNYDQNSQPPSFQLAIDGNIVANITMADSSNGQYVEFQYVPIYSNTLFLCLIRTSSLSTPFVSGITLVQFTDYFNYIPGREFSRDTLVNGYIMKTITRVNFGGTDLIRYAYCCLQCCKYSHHFANVMDKLFKSTIAMNFFNFQTFNLHVSNMSNN